MECAQGSFLNEATGMCELCPIGSYTDTDGQTACTPCGAGQTTLQLGATQCYGEYGHLYRGMPVGKKNESACMEDPNTEKVEKNAIY